MSHFDARTICTWLLMSRLKHNWLDVPLLIFFSTTACWSNLLRAQAEVLAKHSMTHTPC